MERLKQKMQNMYMNIYDDKSVKFKMRSHGKILYRDLIKGMLSMTMLIDFVNGLFSSLHIGEIFRVLLLGIITTAYYLKRVVKE